MKILHLSIILIVIISFDSFNFVHGSCATLDKPCNDLIQNPTTQVSLKQYEDGIAANNIEIQDIQIQPSTIKVGDTFTVHVTLVNNLLNPIYVGHGACEAPFLVTFDNHISVSENKINCTLQIIEQRLDSGEKITATSPYLDLVYKAVKSGTANTTVTFSYSMKNQTDPNFSNIEKIISKSLLFTIYDNSTGFKPANVVVLSPLKQFKSGIAANDVKCQQDLQLVIKSEDGSPTCVKPDDVSRLINIDWAEPANQSHQLELWIFSCGSAYPVGGSMCLDANRPFESPQNFNMTSVVHSFPHDVITLHSHAYCIKLKQYDKVKFGFNSTAPTNFTLYTTSNTLPSTNMVRCATNGKVISEMKNSTSYSNDLNVQEDGLFTFVFDENTPVLANVNFVYSWVPR